MFWKQNVAAPKSLMSLVVGAGTSQELSVLAWKQVKQFQIRQQKLVSGKQLLIDRVREKDHFSHDLLTC